MNEIAPRTDSELGLAYGLAGPAWDRIASTTLSAAKNNLVDAPGGPQIMVPVEPEARQVLASRQALLLREIRGNKHDDKAKATFVADMLGCYGEKRDEDIKKTVAKYVLEVRGLPLWAVSLACQAIKIGQAPEVSPAIRPTTVQVGIVVRRYMAPALAELRDIGDVLRAAPYIKPLTEEEKGRLHDKLSGFADERRSAADADDPEAAAKRAEVGAAAMRRNSLAIEQSYGHREPIKAADFVVSPSLMRSIKKVLREFAAERREGST